MNTIKFNSLLQKVKIFSFNSYDCDVAYCGLYALQNLMSKIKLQKILPFNRFCYLHDRGYNLVNTNFKELTLKQVLNLKWNIDNYFYTNMKKNANSRLKVFYEKSFFYIVLGCTPIYYLMWKISNLNN